MKSLRNLNFKKNRQNIGSSRERTPSGGEKGVRFRECKITEFVWELRKTGFVKVAVNRAVRLRQRPLGQLSLLLHSR